MTTIIKPRLLELLRDNLVANIQKAVVKIDNTSYAYSIFRTDVQGYKIKIFVYVDDRKGQITEAKLIDYSDTELAGKPVNITKGEDGYMIVFEIELRTEDI